MSNITSAPAKRDALRKTMNAKRAALLPADRDRAAAGLTEQFLHWSRQDSLAHLLPDNNVSVAGFIAVRGEIDIAPLLATLRQAGATTCLPVIQSANSHNDNQKNSMGDYLKFGPYDDTTPLREGQYRIPVPDIDDDELLNANTLDLVLVPLVAFDAQGNRLGMGGGFYDRTFEYRTTAEWHHGHRRQAFVGVAHDFQRVEQLPVQPWDVPLDAIITDTTCYQPAE